MKSPAAYALNSAAAGLFNIRYTDLPSLGVFRNSCLQQLYELYIHETVIVRYPQTDQSLAMKHVRELLLDAPDMLLLHREDEIRPADMTGRQLDSRCILRTCRADLPPVCVFENLLRRQAPPLVAAAYEQYVYCNPSFAGFLPYITTKLKYL